MWTGWLNREEKSKNLMIRYCKRDVKLLEDLYTTLRPWVDNHPSLCVHGTGEFKTCPNCDSTHIIRNGLARTNVGTYRRYRCKGCMSPLRGKILLGDAKSRAQRRENALTQDKR